MLSRSAPRSAPDRRIEFRRRVNSRSTGYARHVDKSHQGGGGIVDLAPSGACAGRCRVRSGRSRMFLAFTALADGGPCGTNCRSYHRGSHRACARRCSSFPVVRRRNQCGERPLLDVAATCVAHTTYRPVARAEAFLRLRPTVQVRVRSDRALALLVGHAASVRPDRCSRRDVVSPMRVFVDRQRVGHVPGVRNADRGRTGKLVRRVPCLREAEACARRDLRTCVRICFSEPRPSGSGRIPSTNRSLRSRLCSRRPFLHTF